MLILTPEITNNFTCVGSECPDTCCAGWKIYIDAETYSYYKTVRGDFGKKLADNIRKNGDEAEFILKNNLRCPFLQDDDLCSVYLTLGPDKLCHTCETFPRHMITMDDILLYFLSFACPEAARQFLTSKDKMGLVITEDTSLTKTDKSPLSPNQHNVFVHALTTGIEILQNRNLTLRDRLICFILFITQEQQHIDNNDSDASLLQMFSDSALYQSILTDKSGIPDTDISMRIKLFRLLCNSFFSTNHKNEYLMSIYTKFLSYAKEQSANLSDSILNDINKTLSSDNIQLEMEQLLVYLCFRNLYSNYKEKTLLIPLNNIIAFYCTYVSFLSFDSISSGQWPDLNSRIRILSCLSRYYEHNNSTFTMVHDIMEKNDMISLRALMQLV